MSHKRPYKWSEAPTPPISSNISFPVISNTDLNVENSPTNNSVSPVIEKRFLKGPIPFVWLLPVARLPGKSLHLGVYIWHMAGVRKSHIMGINLSLVSKLFHTSRRTIHRAACELEKASLIKVTRNPGRKLTIEILGGTRDEHKSPNTANQ